MRPLLKALAVSKRIAAVIVGLILYGCSLTSTLADNSSTSEFVARWDFGANEDAKRDQWPDGWSRTSSQQYPKFIPINISRQSNSAEELQEIERFRRFAAQCVVAYRKNKWPWQVIPETVPPSLDLWLERTVLNPFLHVRMDGGAAEILSPIVPVDEHSVYFMTGMIRGNGNDFYAHAKLRFLDASRKTLFEVVSKSVTGKTDWVSIATDTKYLFRDDVKNVQVVLQVHPRNAKAYQGEFDFDTIRIHRTPRLNLFVEKSSQMYREGEQVIVRCTASGMTKEQTSLTLKLVDQNGTEVLSTTKAFVRDEVSEQRYISSSTSQNNAPASVKRFWDGQCEWKLPPLESGYYEITTQLSRGRTGVFELDEQFVVLPNDGLGKLDSRFGWTMPRFSKTSEVMLDINRFIDMLRESRTGKVKVPIWFDSQDPKSMREFTERVDRIQTVGVVCVGVIATPPPSLREKLPRLNSDDSGTALEDSVLIQSFLEPVLRQMCVRIVDFQIGWDHETDFVGNPRFSSSLDSIKRLIRRYGQEAQLLASHNTSLPNPTANGIDRWQLHSQEEMTAGEISDAIERGDGVSGTSKTPWFSITPLDPTKYSLKVRVQDLVSRMMATTKENVTIGTTSWISDPMDPSSGIMDDEGGPREMYLPFRSIAGVLAGARNLGALPISTLGTNYIVATNDNASLVAWANEPTNNQLYLGEKVKARDIWGRKVDVATVETDHGLEQQFTIGPWPVILDGIDLNVARWRTGISIVEKRIDPLKGNSQELQVRFNNPISAPVNGRLQIVAPDLIAESGNVPFEIDANSSGVITVPIQLHPDAINANTTVQLEFQITGDKPTQFAIIEEMQVGSWDVEFDWEYQIDEQDRLWINLQAINNTAEPMSFECMLLIPGRVRERSQIPNLRDRANSSFVLNNGTDLIGESLRLRCEQIGTRRILNFQIKIKSNEDSHR